MTPREWREKNYTEDEEIEMWCEFTFVKKAIGEWKDDSKSKNAKNR